MTAVQARKLSSTSLELHETCNRRSYYKYVMKLPDDPPTPQLEHGFKGHEIIEKYHETGEWKFDPKEFPELLGPAKMFIYPYQPNIDEWLHRETNFNVNLIAGASFTGRIDFINTRGAFLDPFGKWVHEDIPEIGDYKFSASDKYWKSGTELTRNIQMMGYAGAASVRGAPKIRLSHVYLQPKPPYGGRKTTVVVSREKVEEYWAKTLEPKAEELLKTWAQPDVKYTRINHNGCNAFNRPCPYIGVCTRRQNSEELTADLMASLMQKSNGALSPTTAEVSSVASLLDRVMQTQGVEPTPPAVKPDTLASGAAAFAAATAPAGAPPPTASAATASVAPAQGSLMARMAAGASSAPITAPVPGEPNLDDPALAKASPATVAAAAANGAIAGAPGPALMTAAQKREQLARELAEAEAAEKAEQEAAAKAAAEQKAQEEAAEAKAKAERLAAAEAEAAKAAASSAPTGDAAATVASNGTAAPTEAKRGRGRPPGAKNRKGTAAERAASAEVSSNGDDDSINLYVGCRTNFPTETLDGYLADLRTMISQKFQVPDILLGEGAGHPLAFGKWEGVLYAIIRDQPPAPGDYSVDGPTDRVKAVMVEAIASLQRGDVVRGA